jgi:hypothetical protein
MFRLASIMQSWKEIIWTSNILVREYDSFVEVLFYFIKQEGFYGGKWGNVITLFLLVSLLHLLNGEFTAIPAAFF